MPLRSLDRAPERQRLSRALERADSSFVCLYGRRRLGKTRLLRETARSRTVVYHVADEREASLQRHAVASSVATLLRGFDRVQYPDWPDLLERWWADAPAGATLILDEFPYLAQSSPSLPSVLQRLVDRDDSRAVHLVVCGSSQRMMQGLVLDASAPLYGRATEIIRLQPLEAGWAGAGLGLSAPVDIVEAYAIWGGVPRYWELAAGFASTWEAVADLVLDPHGVLHHEPRRLLLDDIRDIAQSASLLALIGAGCNRLSEIAGRIERPATSLTRPLRRLEDLGLVRREQPFDPRRRGGKKTLYRIADPFLGFWYRFVEPRRSSLLTTTASAAAGEVRRDFGPHLGGAWEEIVRRAVPRLEIDSSEWQQPSRWWGAGRDRQPLEVDLVAESRDGERLLVGEVKRSLDTTELARARAALAARAERLPLAADYRDVVTRLFVLGGSARGRDVIPARRILASLR